LGRRVVFGFCALVALLGIACGTDESSGTAGTPVSTPSTVTPTATVTATAGTDPQQPIVATVGEEAATTVIDTAAIAISLPEDLEFLGSGRANAEIIEAEAAFASAYLSHDHSRNLYEYFLKTIKADGWLITDAWDANESSPIGEISATNGEVALLVEIWDLDKTNVTESIDMLSMLWSIELSPEHLAQGKTLIFTATLPCSPGLQVDCE